MESTEDFDDARWNALFHAVSEMFGREGRVTSKEYVELYTGAFDLCTMRNKSRMFREYRDVMSSCVQNDVLPTILAAGSDVLRVLGDCWERCRVVSHIFDPLDRCPERGGRMPPEPHTTIQVARDAFADVCSNEEVKLRVAKAMCRCPAQTEVLQRAKEIYRSLGVDLSENIRAEFREKFERHGMPTDIIELIFSRAGSCERLCRAQHVKN